MVLGVYNEMIPTMVNLFARFVDPWGRGGHRKSIDGKWKKIVAVKGMKFHVDSCGKGPM